MIGEPPPPGAGVGQLVTGRPVNDGCGVQQVEQQRLIRLDQNLTPKVSLTSYQRAPIS
jgi:hypothetical protein